MTLNYMVSIMKEHDLFNFFRNANEDIEREYKRICKRSVEDPGTAGDQGEENWAQILKMWLPPYFQVVTKGRILGDTGETSPQIDVLVLSPEYPKQLVNCKEYLAGGVVAAFECKLTLKRNHIKDLMKTSKIVTGLLEYLSWEYTGLKNLVTYMKKLDIEGVKNGNLRQWNADVLSQMTINSPEIDELMDGRHSNYTIMI